MICISKCTVGWLGQPGKLAALPYQLTLCCLSYFWIYKTWLLIRVTFCTIKLINLSPCPNKFSFL